MPTTDMMHVEKHAEYDPGNSHMLEDIRQLEAENINLKYANQTLDAKLNAMKKQLETANEHMSKLKLKKRKFETDYKKEKKAASKYRKEIKKTSGKIEDLENKVQYYEELDAIRKTEFEAAIDTSIDKSPEISQSERNDSLTPTPSMSVREMLEGSLAALRATNKQLEKKLEDKDKEISHREKATRKLENKISDLENRLYMREAQIEELQSFKEGYTTMEEKLQTKSDTTKAVTDELVKVRLEMKELEAYLSEHEEMVYEYQQKISELKEELRQKQRECEDGECLHAQNLLTTRLEKLNQLTDLNTEIENQESQLGHIKDQLVELNDRLAGTTNVRKRQGILNEIALLQSDEVTLIMDVDILRASQHKINTNLIDGNCLGCNFLGSEANRLRQSRREIIAKLEETQLALAEKEFELSEMRRNRN